MRVSGGAGVPRDGRSAVVTVGTFDGVHRGHWEVLREIRRRADARRGRAILVTFHPHPLEVVNPAMAPPLLTTPREKKEILAESGLDYVVFVRFTSALSTWSPERFVEEILVGRIGVEELVVGYDHGFGRGRSGDVETLRGLGGRLGFDVDVVPPVVVGEEAVSSTRIRRAVADGRIVEAARGLGRPYSFRGAVVQGEGRGRGLGFPTANLRVEAREKLLPPPGVYAVRAILRRGTYPAAMHLGPRPTFEGAPPSVEVHLLDFQGDLYGEEVRVDLVDRLRDVTPFESVDALVAQLHRDVEQARIILSG
ncbi:MAG: bifunctional riboflavin kinase/FAD synthetase [Gemmatimonadales bacterium]|nr:MAG: bifunctional riboflavin kinase/FAD synthetase [Gemmatimonadales bacterium]